MDILWYIMDKEGTVDLGKEGGMHFNLLSRIEDTATRTLEHGR